MKVSMDIKFLPWSCFLFPSQKKKVRPLTSCGIFFYYSHLDYDWSFCTDGCCCHCSHMLPFTNLHPMLAPAIYSRKNLTYLELISKSCWFRCIKGKSVLYSEGHVLLVAEAINSKARMSSIGHYSEGNVSGIDISVWSFNRSFAIKASILMKCLIWCSTIGILLGFDKKTRSLQHIQCSFICSWYLLYYA